MTQAHDIDIGFPEPRFALDYLGCACHGDCHTHIDALCHISYKGQLYNGKPATSVTSRGPTRHGHHHLRARHRGARRAARHPAPARESSGWSRARP